MPTTSCSYGSCGNTTTDPSGRCPHHRNPGVTSYRTDAAIPAHLRVPDPVPTGRIDDGFGDLPDLREDGYDEALFLTGSPYRF